MKAYVLEGIGQLEYKEVAMPVLREGEVLVQVSAAGICGSDIPRIFETGTYHFPMIPGHEFAGIVTDTYRGEEAWMGKRVGVFPLIPCQKCIPCGKSEYEMCQNYNYLGSRCDGGFAEYTAVPAWNLIELPEQMDIREAAMLEPAAVALHAVRKLSLRREDSVALFGLGTIGSIIVQWLSAYGVQSVYAAGHRREYGEVMRETVNPAYQYWNAQSGDSVAWVKNAAGNYGVDIAVDCIGTSESLADCLECVRPGGQILVVGNPKADVILPKKIYWQLLRKQITLQGTWNSSFLHERLDDWQPVVTACIQGQISLSALITHELPFEKLHEGLEVMRAKKEYRNKVMICRDTGKRR